MNLGNLPGHTFLFMEFYCVDPDCDCRRVMLNVLDTESDKRVATINHAFEPPEPPFEDEEQTILDPMNPQSALSEGHAHPTARGDDSLGRAGRARAALRHGHVRHPGWARHSVALGHTHQAGDYRSGGARVRSAPGVGDHFPPLGQAGPWIRLTLLGSSDFAVLAGGGGGLLFWDHLLVTGYASSLSSRTAPGDNTRRLA